MTAHASQSGSALPIAIGGLLVLVLALGLWWALSRSPGHAGAPSGATPAASHAADPAASTPRPDAAPPPRGVRAPAQRIADQGRLSVTREALREGDVLALGLELSDVLRGVGPRPVKVVDVRGRVLESVALPVTAPEAVCASRSIPSGSSPVAT
jgi:hypothetical protein